MTKEERNKKLEEALKDEAFEKELSEVKSAEELKKVFSDRGIEITLDEIHEMIAQAAREETGELDEDVLEEVSGGIGINYRAIFRVIRELLRNKRCI